MVKIYQQPFAHAGTKQVIPDASDPQGFVSNEDGFTTDYELPDTDPNYKPIERSEFNGLMNAITEAVGEIQQFGFAKWQPITWPQGARVVEGGAVYRALTQTSQQPPHADWVADTPDINSILHPSMTGSITLNGTTDNTVAMTDIATELDLEIGDVIRIDTGTYNKLHTVEAINNYDSIVVNYEHAGNRAGGSLKLPDFTGQATVTRIAKWFNAPEGLGQAWVEMMASRPVNIAHSNSTGRTIFVSLGGRKDAGGVGAILVNLNGTGEKIKGVAANELGGTGGGCFFVVPNNQTYAVTLTNGAYITSWDELR